MTSVMVQPLELSAGMVAATPESLDKTTAACCWEVVGARMDRAPGAPEPNASTTWV